MIGQLWRISNLLLCILLGKLFISATESPIPTTSNVTTENQSEETLSSQTTRPDSTTRQTDRPLDSSTVESTSAALTIRAFLETTRAIKQKPTSVFGIVTQKRIPPPMDKVTPLGNDDTTTSRWFLQFNFGRKTSQFLGSTGGDHAYSDRDIYDHGVKTVGEKQKVRDSFNSEVNDSGPETFYVIGILVGCLVVSVIVISILAIKKGSSIKTQREQAISKPKKEEEEYDEDDEDRSQEEFQLKSHWLAELGNKM